jgi:hypothetical protein
MAEIGCELTLVDLHKRELAAFGEAVEGEDATVTEARQESKGDVEKSEKTNRGRRRIPQ